VNTQAPPEPSHSHRDPEVIKTGQCTPGGTPAENFRKAMDRVGELKEYASYFVAAKLDGIKVSLRNAGIYAALGVIGAVAAATMVVVSVVLLLVGAAHALGALFGGRDWAGDLIIGVLILGLMAVGVIVGLKMLTKSFHKTLVDKYESRQHDQRRSFGHDVEQRAKEERRASAR
jgi:putative superfamily III holin-X